MRERLNRVEEEVEKEQVLRNCSCFIFHGLTMNRSVREDVTGSAVLSVAGLGSKGGRACESD